MEDSNQLVYVLLKHEKLSIPWVKSMVLLFFDLATNISDEVFKHTSRAILWVRSVFRHLSSHVQWKYLNYFCPLNLSNYISCDFDNRNFSLIEPLLYSVSWKSAKTNIDSKFWILTCRKSLFWNKSNPQQVLFSSTISGRSNFLIHFLGIIPKEGSAGQVWDSWTSQNVLFSLKIFLQQKVTKQFLNVPKGGHCFRNNS